MPRRTFSFHGWSAQYWQRRVSALVAEVTPHSSMTVRRSDMGGPMKSALDSSRHRLGDKAGARAEAEGERGVRGVGRANERHGTYLRGKAGERGWGWGCWRVWM